ncbi:MAG: FtsX-like permease family protein [Acidobacteria bacterium]|nr:FtsX-like permease family protein [Acidobacteriota bacterium]
MTRRDLTERSLRYYWRTNTAVVAGLAIATATLAGSAIVGESVRESLREIALGRLGNAGTAIAAAQPFTEELARRVGPEAAPMLFFEAVMKHQGTGRTASKVLVYGVDDRFWKLHKIPNPLRAERDIVFSSPLAAEFNAQDGEGILLRIEKPSEIPQETLHARKEQSVRTARFRYRTSLPDSGIGGFTLQPRQGSIRAAFVKLATLQKELTLESRANVLVLSEELRSDLPLLGHLRLEDVGLRITRPAACRCMQLESPSGLLRDDQVQRALATGRQDGLRAEVFLMYMANAIRTPTASVPYSLVIAREGIPEGTIVLNDWTAGQLQAKLGDTLTLDYYLWKQEGRLLTESSTFVVNGVQPREVLGDRQMAPEYPGISDTVSLSDWDPPFPLDLNKIHPQDEKYWDDYRTTPKAAVSLKDGQRLWQTRFGKVTAIRFYSTGNTTIPTLNLTPSTDLARDGITLLLPKQQAEEASRGTTDFGEYFGYFSFFLLVSALLLTGLFFRLGIEQRLREIGLYQAVGFNRGAIRRVFFREGILLGTAGAVLGTVLGAGYSALILYALRTWWVDAVGTTGLSLHFSAAPFTAAVFQGVVMAIIVIALSLRRLRKFSPRQLLAGVRPDTIVATPGWLRITALGLLAAGIILVVSSALDKIAADGGFFGAGFCLLTGGALYCRLWLESPRLQPVRSLSELALASAAQQPARSFLTILLIGLAVFLLVALEAFRQSPGHFDAGRQSGTGGFPLIAESQWPIYQSLATKDGRAALSIDEDAVRDIQVAEFRVRPGEDVSCLNLYQPARPKIVGVPLAFRNENRFRVSPDDAWTRLGAPLPKGIIPAMVDANTMQYVLHKRVGDTIDIPHGVDPIQLRIVGTLSGSLFQSEILIAEESFLKIFPEEQGHRLFLIDASEAMWGMVTTTLEDRLSDSGFDVTPAGDRLAQYHRVENTYLSTFQALGALGLLIGTVGLAAVLLRNVLERRRELALLRAVGYSPAEVMRMIFVENAALLAAGLFIGTLCALLAVLPVLAQRIHTVPVASLGILLVMVAAVGLASTWIATRLSVRAPLLESLRSE